MKRLLTALMLGALATGSVFGQGEAVLSGLDWAPQMTQTFPHRRPVGTGFVLLPGANAIWSTNWLQPAQWLETDAEGTTLNLHAFLNGLQQANRAAVNTQMEWIGCGFAFGARKQHFISASVAEQVSVDVTLPGDVLSLPLLGNLGAGEVTASALHAQLDHIRRYSIGWQAQWTPRWGVGVRLHHLRGFEHLALEDVALNWATDAQTFAWEFSGEATVQTAGTASLFDTLDGNAALEQGFSSYLKRTGDAGWGGDVGFAFHPNGRWTLEASYSGAGRVRWKTEVWSAHWQAEPASFDGIALGAWALDPGALQDSAAIWSARWSDWAADAAVAEESTEAFSSRLPGMWLGQIQRQLGRHGQAQLALRHSQPFGTTLSAGATAPLGRILQANTTYTHGRGVRALGAGMAIRFGGFLWFATADNLLAARVAKIDVNGDQTLWIPLDASRVHIRTGCAWTFGRPRKPQLPKHQTSPSTRSPGRIPPAAINSPSFQ